ncbi:TetR/AcrR family transcriptional regulator [Glaciibacter psychrotolerans]|uniref:AcrR family transcriptional regulator n=1 Tax=Glaciibacter psychrotolerans TaxID=670054 RepID=A0A7Z0J4X9_9MICO|nr:TetR/AcrR family transcriptional regulator [Leifsonia psychrotolerans]NYJ18308.1 AcrR family transcriptional regulator [Leifsonia psychrotolerans]
MAQGLRETKMLAARRAMESAAVSLAYDEGVRAVTVERVCAAAIVSRSTFFNYFASLDEAIFGTALEYDPSLTEAILSSHSRDLVVAANLIVVASVRGQSDDTITQQRLALFVREPGVTSAVSWASNESRERLVTVIREWLDAHPELARLDDADHATEARLTVGLSIAMGDEVIRHAHEVDGEFPTDLEALHTARRRMAAISMPAE